MFELPDLTEKETAILKVLAYSMYAVGITLTIVAFSCDFHRLKKEEGGNDI